MYSPSGTVTCPCGHTEHGVTDINTHAVVGITMQLTKCQKCDNFKPYSESNKRNVHGCCSPVTVIEDNQSLRTREWWKKVIANNGRIP